jgi:hypothetical protein
MRKRLMIAILGGAMLVAPGLTTPARASHDWFSIGTAFRVGAAHISFVFGRPSFLYAPAYYYRYDRPIRYHGHRCSRYCFHDAGYYYHHDSCPLVGAHFSHYRVDPYWAFDRYAPRYDGYGHYDRYGDYGRHGDYGYYDGYRGRDRYSDRYDRYDRYGSRRGYDRYDRRRGYDRDYRYDRDRGHRGRGRGHQHRRGCGHY